MKQKLVASTKTDERLGLVSVKKAAALMEGNNLYKPELCSIDAAREVAKNATECPCDLLFAAYDYLDNWSKYYYRNNYAQAYISLEALKDLILEVLA